MQFEMYCLGIIQSVISRILFCIFPVYVFCGQGTLILNPFSQIAFQNPQIITNTKKKTWSTKAKTIPLPGPQKTMYLHRLSSKTQTARKNLSLYYSHSNTSHPPKNNNEQRIFLWNFLWFHEIFLFFSYQKNFSLAIF